MPAQLVPDPEIVKHSIEDWFWRVIEWGVAGLIGIGLWFAKRDRHRLDEDTAAMKKEQENIWKRVNATDKDLREFKTHVAEDYVSRATLDTHVVESLRRIESKLDVHIAQQNGGKP